MANIRLRINERIRLPEVLLVDEEGQKVGVVPTSEALKRARDLNLDLVEIAPNLRPPVCKIIDYGKYKYEQGKALSQQRKKSKVVGEKEMRLSLNIDDHDLAVKVKKVDQFLAKGHKVKVVVRFKGREITHPELGRQVLAKFLGLLTTPHEIDKETTKQGRQLFTIINPKK
ncbi:MAG: translation initiation factor IF-3 [Patescibacteria group bacterium]|nr:translation initiation factor IF-3 [Patescibacteria group bacterium]